MRDKMVLKRFCKEFSVKEGIDGSVCDDEEIFEIIARIFDVLDEKYQVLDELLDEVLMAVEERDVGELTDILASLLDEIIGLIGNGGGDVSEELSSALKTVLGIYGVEAGDELDYLINELAFYEVFLERIKRRLEAIRDVLTSRREQLGEGLRGF